VKLLKDNEAEVRTAIAGQIPGFCALVDRQTLLNEIMGSIEDLVSDSSQHVRAALGTQISGLAPILGKQEYVTRLLLAKSSVANIFVQNDRSPAAYVPPDAQGRVP
jgi:serine/threonine-protein phosphatase 2A regulatory subunit A